MVFSSPGNGVDGVASSILGRVVIAMSIAGPTDPVSGSSGPPGRALNRISSISNGVVSPVVDLSSPGAVEVAADGTIYATTGVFAPSGSVVIVTP